MGKSGLTNMLTVLRRGSKEDAPGKGMDIVYTDFNKAFYKVPPHG